MSDNVTREPYRNAWYKQLQKAIEEAEPRLVPEYNAEDASKILSVDEEGKQAWIEPPEELPAIQDGDEGKVLKVEEGMPTWSDVPKELPEATAADEGKVVMVDSNGDYVLGAASAGYVVPFAVDTAIQIDSSEVINND